MVLEISVSYNVQIYRCGSGDIGSYGSGVGIVLEISAGIDSEIWVGEAEERWIASIGIW